MPTLGDAGFDLILRQARSYRYWQAKPVADELLAEIWQLARLGPSGSETSPLRILYIRTPEAKARLLPHMDEGNRHKVQAAPVTAVLAADYRFYERLDYLKPESPDARSWFEGDEAVIQAVATSNAWLQAGYFILTARGLGLDCGPMGGFNPAGVDAEFLAGTHWRSILTVNLGYGDPSRLHPRNPKLEVAEVCRFL
jgi:3-hydroxypropanoate dehydrogenase